MSEKETLDACNAWANEMAKLKKFPPKTPWVSMAFEAGAAWANERAAKRIAELEAALEPLKALSDRVFDDGMNSSKTDDTALYGFDGVYITYGDLRRARAVLSQEKQHD